MYCYVNIINPYKARYTMSEYANYDDVYEDEETDDYDRLYGDPKKLTVGKIIKRIFKYGFRIIAIAVFGIMFWRIISSGDTKLAKSFIWNESAISAYNSDPSAFKVYDCSISDNITDDGKFSLSNSFYVPSTGQFQFTVRYNNSTVKKLLNEYDLKEEPTGEIFVFTLTDNLGNTYTDYDFVIDEKNLYNYRRIIFDGIDLSANKITQDKDGKEVKLTFSSLTLNIYYIDDVVLSEPYGSLLVYTKLEDRLSYPQVDINKYMFKDNLPTKNLVDGIRYIVKEDSGE